MESLLLLRCSSVRYSTFRLSSSSLQPSIVSRVRYVLNHYWLGSKLLYRDWKSVQAITKKFTFHSLIWTSHLLLFFFFNRDENSLTRVDHLSLQRFRYDIRVGIPFVALFSVPILGYSAPLLAILAPKYLPSTLIMPTQQVISAADRESFIAKPFVSGEILTRGWQGFVDNHWFISHIQSSSVQWWNCLRNACIHSIDQSSIYLIFSSVPFSSNLREIRSCLDVDILPAYMCSRLFSNPTDSVETFPSKDLLSTVCSAFVCMLSNQKLNKR